MTGKPAALSAQKRNAYAKPYIATANKTANSASGIASKSEGVIRMGNGFVKTVAKPAISLGKDITSQGSLDYAVGDMVKHVKFGEGTVKKIEKGARDYEVTVDFKGFGIKKMFAGFAKLTKL